MGRVGSGTLSGDLDQAASQKRSGSLILAQTLVYEFDFTIAGSAGVRYFFGVVCRLAQDH
jgi:hypothetical protein